MTCKYCKSDDTCSLKSSSTFGTGIVTANDSNNIEKSIEVCNKCGRCTVR